MKKTFKTLAAALLLASAFTAGFTACQDKLVADGTDNGNSGNDEYSIVLTRSDGTKATTANLGMRKNDGAHDFTATLYKNNEPVDNSLIDWSWEQSGDYFESLYTGSDNHYIRRVQAVGHGTQEVQGGTGGGTWASAAISGKTVAVSEQADVNVTDNRDPVCDHPKTINLHMKIKKNYSATGPITIKPYMNICDTDDNEGEEKEVDMESLSTIVYLDWTFSTALGTQFKNCYDDYRDPWDYTDYSWLVYLSDIEIYSEESKLTNYYVYSIGLGDYSDETHVFTTSYGSNMEYLRFSDYYVKPEWQSKEGKDKVYYSPISQVEDLTQENWGSLTNIAWDKIPDDCFNIYVYLDLSQLGYS